MLNINEEIHNELKRYFTKLQVNKNILLTLNRLITLHNKGVAIKSKGDLKEHIDRVSTYTGIKQSELNIIKNTNYRVNEDKLSRCRSSITSKKTAVNELLSEWEPIYNRLMERKVDSNTLNEVDYQSQSFVIQTIETKIMSYKKKSDSLKKGLDYIRSRKYREYSLSKIVGEQINFFARLIIKRYFELLNEVFEELFQRPVVIKYNLKGAIRDFNNLFGSNVFEKDILSFIKQNQIPFEVDVKFNNSKIKLKMIDNIISNVELYEGNTKNPEKEYLNLIKKYPGMDLMINTLGDIGKEKDFLPDWEPIADSIHNEMIKVYGQETVMNFLQIRKQYSDYILQSTKAKEYHYGKEGLEYLSLLFNADFQENSISFNNKVFHYQS